MQNTGGVLELQANKSLSDRFSLYGSLGYGGFAGAKDIGVSGSSILPILAGFNINSKIFNAGLGFGYKSANTPNFYMNYVGIIPTYKF
ncbi:hypothetical protein V7S79_09890 [Aquirufa sp. ROCK-SH2]